MPEAISDTGPVLHLQEVGRLTALTLVDPLLLPDLVMKELKSHGLGAARLREAGIDFTVQEVEPLEWRKVVRDIAPTGTVGLLIRAYAARSISREEMEAAFEALFEKSTLHLGPAFRAYVRKLLADLP